MNVFKLTLGLVLLNSTSLNAQFDDMKALGITQVHPGQKFSSNVGETESEVMIWRYNSNRTDSSLVQEKMTKSYNAAGAPYLISFANVDPRFQVEYNKKLLMKITQHGEPDNPFTQVFKMTYDAQNRISTYKRISIEDDGSEDVTSWTNYTYAQLTDSTDSVILDSKYGTSSLHRKFKSGDKLIAFSLINSRGYLLDEGILVYDGNKLSRQTVIRHSRSGDQIDQYNYDSGLLKEKITTKEGEMIETETFLYSDEGRILMIEHFRTWRSLNRQYHTYSD
jgi:hypothetical protein